LDTPLLLQSKEGKMKRVVFLDRDGVINRDSAKDIQCGLGAGCAKNLLVATGNGKKAIKTLADKGIHPDFYGADLFEVAQWIIQVKPL
jgi:histidinol phosphatase-like enzyme